MKRLIFLLLFIPGLQPSFAQNLQVSAYGGWLHAIAKRGPQAPTAVSDVKFVKPVTKTLGIALGTDRPDNFNVGVELFYDEFDYGYRAQPYIEQRNVSITSGVEATFDRIAIYKLGFRVGYAHTIGKRFSVKLNLVPSIGFFPHSRRLEDTTGINDFFRDPRYEIQYVQYPSQQNNGPRFFAKASIEAGYNMSPRLEVLLAVSYQQGFSAFVSDTVNIIRPYAPGGKKMYEYWTTVNGTSLQFHAGLSYKLFRKKKD